MNPPDRCWHWWRRRTLYAWDHLHGTFADIGARYLCKPCRRRRIFQRLEDIADTRPDLRLVEDHH